MNTFVSCANSINNVLPSNEPYNPIGELLYGSGHNHRKVNLEVPIKNKEMAIYRSNYRRRCLERYHKITSHIGAPEKNENVRSLGVTKVIRQAFSPIVKRSEPQMAESNYSNRLDALAVTVVAPLSNLLISNTLEEKTAKQVEVPVIKEEAKEQPKERLETPPGETSSTEDETPEIDMKSTEKVKPSSLFLVDLLGPITNGLKLKPLVFLYFKAKCRPIPKNAKVVKFLITRNKIGISKKLYTTYELYSFTNSKFIMKAEKKQIMGSAYYGISLEKDDAGRMNEGYIGKVRSNSGSNEFNLFGEGENPKSGARQEQVRDQYASAIFCSKSRIATKKEDINILLPKILDDGNYHMWRPMNVIVYAIYRMINI